MLASIRYVYVFVLLVDYQVTVIVRVNGFVFEGDLLLPAAREGRR